MPPSGSLFIYFIYCFFSSPTWKERVVVEDGGLKVYGVFAPRQWLSAARCTYTAATITQPIAVNADGTCFKPSAAYAAAAVAAVVAFAAGTAQKAADLRAAAVEGRRNIVFPFGASPRG